MTSNEIRQIFLDYFKSRNHRIVSSAPMVIKDDPTLMFTNAGMNQFKDVFLGNSAAVHNRIADTQKCLRVSGKHNDLEEVGYDTYHHTMFEMLGNWSFGDYFKKEAIAWAWELLTKTYGIDPEILYVTVFEGDEADGLPEDSEARSHWREFVPEERILSGNKKDNFWEMGETGPCGPCSEIHADLRPSDEKAAVPGRSLVNTGDPQVIEIWNLVFIEFNRQADGKLKPLPARHIDTGMGFERLCRLLQGKQSNYDTDVFQPLIREISVIAGKPYGVSEVTDVAMRVMADHIRAIAFAIADGQLPSNNKAGYVIRRILRRAVRFAFSFLDLKDPVLYRLIPVLVQQMGDYFPELRQQKDLIIRVIMEEEHSFLRTLATGIQKFDVWVAENTDAKVVDGGFAFELFDTYGFPVDLTRLIAREKGLSVDMEGFRIGLEAQKKRSRKAAEKELDDWVELLPQAETQFVGWDTLEHPARLLKYRKMSVQGRMKVQLVLDITPFYAEAGGQVGDKGWLTFGEETIAVLETIKENNLTIHVAETLPTNPAMACVARVDGNARRSIMRNHSATHLLHKALREVLGSHVEQKGSLVDDSRLRFDFSHFQKVSEEEIFQVEEKVNRWIMENRPREEMRTISMDEARNLGAMALFGEKYGDTVRVIRFGDSLELCGGTHVQATGEIGFFKILSESAIAAGIRRMEAITGEAAFRFVKEQSGLVSAFRDVLKSPADPLKALMQLISDNNELRKQLEESEKEKNKRRAADLMHQFEDVKGVMFLASRLELDAASARDIAFQLRDKTERMFLVLGYTAEGKTGLAVMISDELVTGLGLHAGNIVRELAREIDGGGGGQPFFASAGGKNPAGLDQALLKARQILMQRIV